MTPEQRRQIESLCLQALTRDANQRDAFLDEACGGDEELRREVQSMLAVQPGAPAFLETPAWAVPAVPLATGTRLGPYEIQSVIGTGGMGVVYKARDTRLDRTVAIKVLPADVRVERRARFETEAKTVAGLSHPHICSLYDVGEYDGSMFFVMEHLSGETLSARLRRGPLPSQQALAIAADVADALSAAHRQGVVHRDVKPGNVMLTKSGGAKLLDFGLAKLAGSLVAASAATRCLGTNDPQTEAGIVLGTVPYMAPEQVEGKEADARSDIFSFGAVLYEMLTGKRAFEGESHGSVAAAILRREPPPLSSITPLTQPFLDRLVHQCLSKSPDDRPDSAHDVANELRWLRESNATGAVASLQRGRGRRVRTAFVVAAGLALIAVGAAVMWFLRPAAPSPLPIHSTLAVFPAESLNAGSVSPRVNPTAGGTLTALAWTPDGRALVFVGRRGAVQQLYVLRLHAREATPLPGTEGARVPAVSPDGRRVAFWAGGAIRQVAIDGGPVADLLAAGGTFPPWGLAWDSAGTLFVGGVGGGEPIRAIPSPNTVKPVTTLGDGEETHGLPWPLPGGRVLLYTVRKSVRNWGDAAIVAENLTDHTREVLLTDAADARYVSTGHLVFLRQGRLFAVPFDRDRVRVGGSEVALLDQADHVAQALTGSNSRDRSGAGHFAVASTGALAWLPGPVTPHRSDATLVTVDRHGHVSPVAGVEARAYSGVRISPDNRWLAVTIQNSPNGGLWFLELGSRRWTQRTLGECGPPVWSPDSQRVAFVWRRNGRRWLAIQRADGTTPPRILMPDPPDVSSFTSDGRQIAAVGDAGIFMVSAENDQAVARRLFESPGRDMWPEFSPDGQWIAYGSDVSGRNEVWVRRYPTGAPVLVGAGSSPAWHSRSRQLFYLSPTDQSGKQRMMVVEFAAGTPQPTIVQERLLFNFPRTGQVVFDCRPLRCYDVAPDGQHFYVRQYPVDPPPPPVTHINLVLNWFEELKARVPVGR